jgi:hypothetical protein
MLAIACVAAVATLSSGRADDSNYQADSKITKTINRDAEGNLVSVIRIAVTRVSHIETVTDTLTKNGEGQLRVSARKTEQVNTSGNKTITEESLSGDPPKLTITTLTVLTKGANSSSMTEQQTPGPGGALVVSQRTIVARNSAGALVTTVETRNDQGQMIVTKQEVKE